ncbi:hypothetical protein CS0771_22690 [Catellatospora sp. IY07-71]|uniref:hypothetical protein n=1 Tax=Catellatospora sp. IY07-71 TaxID=2728827 RepID=UPI001BB406C4|nr:hypothetical protein [Catellatospora sp. IY07-71]BCJ72725.1 hypothetical protein CS0771_22690 [Catellatospora sp. IY07-71]
MNNVRPPWISLPKAVRVAARAARADRPHADPAVQEALQVRARLYRAAAATAGLGFYSLLALRLFQAPLRPELFVPYAALFWADSKLGEVYRRVRTQAVAQWPGLAARAAGPPSPVRLRPPALWYSGTIVGVGAFPVLLTALMHQPDWFYSDDVTFGDLGDGLKSVFSLLFSGFMWVLVAASLVWFVFTAGSVRRRLRHRTCLEVDHTGVRLPARRLRLSWADIAEIAIWPRVKPQGMALRLHDPTSAVRGSGIGRLWRRLRPSRPPARPSPWVVIDVSDVRGELYPAYRAALAFHHAAVGAAEDRAAETAR